MKYPQANRACDTLEPRGFPDLGRFPKLHKKTLLHAEHTANFVTLILPHPRPGVNKPLAPIPDYPFTLRSIPQPNNDKGHRRNKIIKIGIINGTLATSGDPTQQWFHAVDLALPADKQLTLT